MKSNKQLLRGTRFLNTRPRGQSEELSLLLNARGAEAVDFPCVEIAPCADQAQLLEHVKAGPDTLLLFTSANGVRAVQETLDLSTFSIATIGERTSSAVERARGRPVFTAEESSSEAFAEELMAFLMQCGRLNRKTKVVLLRGDSASESLPALLAHPLLTTISLVVYRARPPHYDDNETSSLAVSFASEPGFTGIIFTSSDTIKNFSNFMRSASAVRAKPVLWEKNILGTPCFVIGPKTAATAAEMKFVRVVTSPHPSIERLVDMVEGAIPRGAPNNSSRRA